MNIPIAQKTQTPKEIIEIIAKRYLGNNPCLPYCLREFNTDGFMQDEQAFYHINLNEKITACEGEICVVQGNLFCPHKMCTNLQIIQQSTCRVFLNGQSVPITSQLGLLTLNEGDNLLEIHVEKTKQGFGCFVKVCNLLNVFMPNSQQGGFSYTFQNSTYPKTETFQFLPQIFEKYYTNANCIMYAYTQIKAYQKGLYNLQINTDCSWKLYLNNQFIAQGKNDAQLSIRLETYLTNCIVEIYNDGKLGSFAVESKELVLQKPFQIQGNSGPFLFLGMFCDAIEIQQITCPQNVFEDCLQQQTYFKTNAKNTVIRAYYENSFYSLGWINGLYTNFGRWDYPLGVTLYGLYNTGYKEYVNKHIEVCLQFLQYAKYDKLKYGFCNINFQLGELRMLDNCGSFGSVMLESGQGEDLAHTIADFMLQSVEKTKEGAFYRKCTGEYLENTLWADDTYMSVPFLKRYYLLTKNKECLSLAEKQFILYKHYLWIEQHNVLSHVYDFKVPAPTNIAWGRANGWYLFSLAELLMLGQQPLENYEQLVEIFQQLANGCKNLQGKNGLWHQVLTNDSSFEETSCSAMFVYAFCVGVQLGILSENEYRPIILKGYEGLINYAIDSHGNVFGVCHGSLYSFEEKYYVNELKPVVNDNHGIGIVLLALQKIYESLL